MKEREYLARLDDGHDYTEITYYSFYRKGSQKNKEDLFDQIKLQWGYNRSRNLKVVSIDRI